MSRANVQGRRVVSMAKICDICVVRLIYGKQTNGKCNDGVHRQFAFAAVQAAFGGYGWSATTQWTDAQSRSSMFGILRSALQWLWWRCAEQPNETVSRTDRSSRRIDKLWLSASGHRFAVHVRVGVVASRFEQFDKFSAAFGLGVLHF